MLEYKFRAVSTLPCRMVLSTRLLATALHVDCCTHHIDLVLLDKAPRAKHGTQELDVNDYNSGRMFSN